MSPPPTRLPSLSAVVLLHPRPTLRPALPRLCQAALPTLPPLSRRPLPQLLLPQSQLAATASPPSHSPFLPRSVRRVSAMRSPLKRLPARSPTQRPSPLSLRLLLSSRRLPQSLLPPAPLPPRSLHPAQSSSLLLLLRNPLLPTPAASAVLPTRRLISAFAAV